MLKCTDGLLKIRREIGIEYPKLYDGVSVYECPDCKFRWKRFAWVPDKYLEG